MLATRKGELEGFSAILFEEKEGRTRPGEALRKNSQNRDPFPVVAQGAIPVRLCPNPVRPIVCMVFKCFLAESI